MMSSLLHKKTTKMAIGVASFRLLRYLQFPHDAAKLISLASFGYFANRNDIEFVTPLLLTPAMLGLLSHLKSHHIKTLYALSTGYITVELLYHPNAIPRNIRIFFEKNSGLKMEQWTRLRNDCAVHGWITKECSDSVPVAEAVYPALKKTAMSVAVLQILTMIMRAFVTRRVRLDPKQNVAEWARTVMFCYSIIMMVGGLGMSQYNKLMPRLVGSYDIKEYRPSKVFQTIMFASFAYIGIHFQNESKHRLLTSYLFVQAVITRLN